jgi:hypothetical protein
MPVAAGSNPFNANSKPPPGVRVKIEWCDDGCGAKIALKHNGKPYGITEGKGCISKEEWWRAGTTHELVLTLTNKPKSPYSLTVTALRSHESCLLAATNNPPSSGTIAPLGASIGPFKFYVPKVEIKARDGMINYGFDNTGPEPWTSVCKNSEQNVVKLTIAPAEIVPQTELVIASGANSADVTPKTFTSSTTDLTIIGKNAKGTTVINAIYKPTATVLTNLNVMVLPKRTPGISVGIYRIEDPESEQTRPVGGPSDDDIINTLKDIFKQACIDFTLAEGLTTNIVYDANNDGKAQDAEISTVIVNGLERWQGQIKVFLFKNSGYPYPSCDGVFVRGYTPSAFLSVVFTSALTDNTIAHEVGHQLGLATRNNDVGDKHDAGPYPPGTESLMRSGISANCVQRIPIGRWLRQEDWAESNRQAGQR